MVLKHCFQGKSNKNLRSQTPLKAASFPKIWLRHCGLSIEIQVQLRPRARCSIYISRSSSCNKTIFWWRLAEPDEENEMLASG